MAILPIVKHPSPLLSQISTDVTQWNADLEQLARNMLDTMYFARGVGLAAIQVGVPLRVYVVDLVKDRVKKPMVLINPKIIARSGEIQSTEGCLSYPGYEGKVLRSAKVTVEAFDFDQKKFRVKGEGLLARVLQHEYDHLEGIMFLDKLLPDSLHPITKSSEM